MSAIGKDGVSLRETLEVVQKMTGRVPAELDCPDLPVGSGYLWGWFVRLNSTRQMGMSANAITEQEIQCYFSNRRITPTAWELDVIASLDQVMLESLKKARSGN